jgi:hypothetical protein
MYCEAPSAIVQKCFTPLTTYSEPSWVTTVSIRRARERLTAGSLPQLPKRRPCSTTSRK